MKQSHIEQLVMHPIKKFPPFMNLLTLILVFTRAHRTDSLFVQNGRQGSAASWWICICCFHESAVEHTN
jgi:hypothetical protein